MSGSIFGRATVDYGGPNVLLDPTSYSRGQNDALTIQKNRLLLDRDRRTDTADQAFRSAAPGAIGGDPAALNAAIAADPDRGMALQTQLASLDAGKRKRVMENMTLLGQGAASLLALPDDQAATIYPGLVERLKGAGVDTSPFPPAYPGRAAVESFARGLTPITDQLKSLDERIVPAGGGGVQQYQPIIDTAAKTHGVDPRLVGAVIGAESGGRPDAVSPKGATGLMQIMPATGRELGLADPRNPGQNIDKGTQYLGQMIQKYGGDQTMGLIAYNWGPGNTDAWVKRGANPAELPAETQAYVRDVHRRLQQASQPQPLVRQGNGMPVTQGAQPGMMWAQGPGGQRVQMPIPGAGERIKPPEGFRYSADGTQFEAIPGGPNDPNYKAQIKAAERGDGPYQGTGMDAQDANILLRGDPTTQEYAAAFNRQNSPRFFPDGSRVDPNMSAYRPPQYAGPGVPQPQQQDGQPAPQPAVAPAGGMTRVPQQAPATVVTGMLENAASLQKIDDAFAALASPDAKGSVGPLAGGVAGLPFVGQTAINTVDPRGVAVRAIIADIGSLKVHDRSGAAVAASEQPRLRPFIPSASDDPQTVRTKLQNFRREYAAIMRDTYSVFGPDGGYKALPVIENTLRRVEQPAEQSGGVKDGAIAVNDETGERLIRRNGQWVPAP
jgi:soluble lytic murein transglycosylase-like protein